MTMWRLVLPEASRAPVDAAGVRFLLQGALSGDEANAQASAGTGRRSSGLSLHRTLSEGVPTLLSGLRASDEAGRV